MVYFFAFGFVIHFSSIAQKGDAEEWIKAISYSQEQGRFAHSLKLCDEVFKRSDFKDWDKDNQWTLICYSLDGCSALRDKKLFKHYFDYAYAFIKSNPVTDSDLGENKKIALRMKFNFLYYKAQLHVNNDQIDSSILSIMDAIVHVTKYPHFYAESAGADSMDSRQNRLWQSHSQLAGYYSRLKDYSNAYNHHMKAYRYACEVDSLILKFELEEYSRQERQLSRIAQFAIQTNQQHLYNQTLNSLEKLNTTGFSSAYSTTIKLSKYNDQIISSKSKNELDFINTNLKSFDSYKTDRSIKQILAQQYLLIKEPAAAFKEIKDYRKMISTSSPTRLDQLKLLLLESEYYLKIKSYTEFSVKMQEAKLFIDQLFNDKVLVSQINTGALTELSKYISYLVLAFEKTADTKYLLEVRNITDRAYPILYSLRDELESGQDKSILLNEFRTLVENAIRAYFLSQAKEDNLNWSAVLNYFELNKSYNLFQETAARQSFKEDKDRIAYETNKMELEKLEYEMKSSDVLDEKLNSKKAELFQKQRILYSEKVVLDNYLLTINKIRSELNEDGILVEYFITDLHLYILQISKHKNKILAVPIDRLKLKSLVDDYRSSLSSFYIMSPALRDSTWKKAAHSLYLALLKPIENTIQDHEIVLVPDGILHQISFASLLDSIPLTDRYHTWPFALKKYRFNIQHSARMWSESQSVRHQNSQNNGLVILAPKDPTLTYNIEEAKCLIQKFSNVGRIKDNLKPGNRFERMQEAKFLHVSAHAYSSANADRAYIKLLNDSMYSYQIAYRSIPNDMVFLSACETGHGQVENTEGVMSLARSFFKAGAKSVISTLWSINDKLSKDQVLSIYDNLSNGLQKNRAVENMQLQYISGSDHKYAHPYYWAAFQVAGDMSPINGLSQKNLLEKNWIGLVSFFLLIIAYFIWKSFKN